MFQVEKKCTNMNYDFSNKVVLITGAGRREGIGSGMASAFASYGAKVMISDIGKPEGSIFSSDNIGLDTEMKAIESELTSNKGEVKSINADVRFESEIENAVSRTVKCFGSIDIMINNAGIGYLMSPFLDLKKDNWDAVLEVNLRGVFFGIKHAAKQMIKQSTGGRIINISSQAAKRGFRDLAAYVASKHGLVGLTKTAALELGSNSITVNSICPNHITTKLGQKQNQFRADTLGVTVDQLLNDRKNNIPLRRLGLVSDITDMCLYLCSENGSYITGQNIDISGGQEMH